MPSETNIKQRTPRALPSLAIVVPCYNEFEVIDETVPALRKVLARLLADNKIKPDSYVCLVNDGSSDGTWLKICGHAQAHPDVRGLSLSRNFGHQGAVLAGMMECQADAIVTIDADLQDDETRIIEMVDRYLEGAEIVYGVRSDRSTDGLFKKNTAQGYYKILALLGVNIVYNHADYRLMSQRAIGFLRDHPETNLFLRGVVPLLGLRTAVVEYARRERFAGESKYPLKKMLALAWNGVTSFSVAPLRWVSIAGMVISLLAFAVSIWALYQTLIAKTALPGWASTVIPMYFLGGIQILCIGVIGEYIGKIFMESKRRPKYLIGERCGDI